MNAVAEIDTHYIIENKLGEQLSTHDSLRWAEAEAKRLAQATGQVLSVASKRRLDHDSRHDGSLSAMKDYDALRELARDQLADDWEEYDPRDHEECSEFNETPA